MSNKDLKMPETPVAAALAKNVAGHMSALKHEAILALPADVRQALIGLATAATTAIGFIEGCEQLDPKLVAQVGLVVVAHMRKEYDLGTLDDQSDPTN